MIFNRTARWEWKVWILISCVAARCILGRPSFLLCSQPINCIFRPIKTLNWLVAASKLHKHRGTGCTAECPYCRPFAILCLGHRDLACQQARSRYAKKLFVSYDMYANNAMQLFILFHTAICIQAQTANIFTRLFTLYNMTFAVWNATFAV